MKKNKFVLFIIKLLLFISLFFGLVIRYFQPNLFDFFIYWWMLILIVLIGMIFHFKSLFYLTAGFILFFVSALFTVIGIRELGEIIMRLSLIGWLIGLAHALVEYKSIKE